MSEQYLLEMKGICKSFPGVKALQNVDLQLKAGEVHALLGENGAGKSTLIKVLGGIYHAEEGEIIIDGQKVNIDGVVAARQAGISIVHQELVLVPYMTVAENIFLGREPGTKMNVDRRKMVEEAQKLLDTYEMNIDANMLVERLTIAQQQMVEIVKAISFNSKILVLDEPTSSISDKEVGFLFNTMRNLTKAGVGIIYISHKMSELAEICDRVTVMRDGQTVGTKVVKETTTDELIALMVGRELTNYYTRDYLEPGEVILKCEHISDGKMAKDASFELHKGEIIGFAGLVGAGRSEIMEAIFGATRLTSGEVILGGKPVHFKNPMQAIKAGIALVPEDRKKQGLVLGNSVAFNLTLSSLRFYMNGIAISEKKRGEVIDHYSQRLRIKAASPEIEAGSLSGGNQQKVVLGKWLATKPDVLILDEPTRGVDVNAKFEIYTVINELAKEGIAIIMVSSELPEIINMCDNVCVVRAGRLVKKLSKDELSQEEIMKYAAGGIE